MRFAERTIFITQEDRDRLLQLLQGAGTPADETAGRQAPSRSVARRLSRALNQAEIVPPRYLPDNVITLHAPFRLRFMDTGEVHTCELVFPGERCRGKKRVSVLSRLGGSLLGGFVGETVRVAGREGVREAQIVGILHGFDPSVGPG